MNIKLKWITTISVIASVLVTFVNADALKEEFSSLKVVRESRASVISYLKSTDVVKESIDGKLKAIGVVPETAQKVLNLENKDRERMFEIIAEIQQTSKKFVAQEFAERMGVDTSAPQLLTTMRIHGSNTVGASLAPELVISFLKKQGFSNISIERKGVESSITYQRPGKKELGVVEIKAHGSSTAFGETSSTKNVGLSGRRCDIGMASRPIKNKEYEVLKKEGLGDLRTAASEFPIALDGVAVVINRSNQVKALTVEEIAKIFAGQVTNWKQLGGEDVEIQLFARDEQSGTWDTFKSRVLKPYKLSLATTNVKRYEDSALLVRNVASNKGGIGFTGLAYVDSSVKGLAVQAGREARAFQPNRLTVKTQDYPLARLLYFYLPIDANQMSRELVKYVMANEGQAVVDKVGLVGQGLSTARDLTNAEKLKKQLINDPAVPSDYKKLIKFADRKDTQANIRFLRGSNQLDINSVNNLDRLSSYLANSGNEKLTVILIGFTDNTGRAVNNLKLSKKRAVAVQELLLSKGVSKIEIAGFGEEMPVADNGSNTGRSQNRRVEIWLKRASK